MEEKEKTDNGTPIDCTYTLPNLAKINEFILADPNDGKLFRIRSQILLDSGRLQEALSDAKRALSLNPEDLYNFVVVAKAHRALGQIDSALSACLTARNAGFNDPDNLMLLGDLYLIIKQYAKSLEYLNQALKLAPFEPKIYYLKGVLFWEKNDTLKALSNWQTAIEQDPGYGDGYAKLSSYYIGIKDFTTAEQYLRSGLRLKPNDAFLHYDMGVYLNYKGYPDSAITYYERAIALDQKLFLAQENLGYLRFNKRAFSEAIPLFETSLLVDAKNSTLVYRLGQSYIYVGEYAKAEIELQKVVQLDKEFVPDALKELVRVRKQLAIQKLDSAKIMEKKIIN